MGEKQKQAFKREGGGQREPIPLIPPLITECLEFHISKIHSALPFWEGVVNYELYNYSIESGRTLLIIIQEHIQIS